MRPAYRDSALAIQAAFWKQFEAFIADFYDSELLAIGETVEGLVGKRCGSDAFGTLQQRATQLVGQITTQKPAASAP
ncbi:hypothetical protein EJP69_23685 [Variovorax gossypii]|uniref:Uncharacterized protein n=1 Tax=Variovorax gossypii TaxID=1679495 RepID=A0A3S0JTE9_9BURK|nr:hypothetical protein [Variovorax gossypii]RTQ32270.1 hypothetical protein EJP69_23685 [Variovorax gossypii]